MTCNFSRSSFSRAITMHDIGEAMLDTAVDCTVTTINPTDDLRISEVVLRQDPACFLVLFHFQTHFSVYCTPVTRDTSRYAADMSGAHESLAADYFSLYFQPRDSMTIRGWNLPPSKISPPPSFADRKSQTHDVCDSSLSLLDNPPDHVKRQISCCDH